MKMKFVEKANLPENAQYILIGEKYSDILKKPIENMGLYPIFVPDNPEIDMRVSGHVDLSAMYLNAGVIALAPYLKGSAVADKLEKLGMKLVFPCLQQGENYPDDVGFNLCLCGEHLIYNDKSACGRIVEYLTIGAGVKEVKVRQGYSKCSVCILKKDVIITSDEGIYNKALEKGIKCLKIRQGHFELPGFDYGFIGGSSFKISHDKIAFTGTLENHPDKGVILDFLSLHNIKPVYITNKPAFDIGGAIQIVEKTSF